MRFLTRKHLYPSNFEKLFSPPVTAGIKYLVVQDGVWNYNFTTSLAIVEYMEMMYKFFQIHDVSDRVQHIRQRNEDCTPYVSVDDEKLRWMMYTFPQYVDSIQQSSAENHVPGLTNETAQALKFTCKSTAECIEYLLRVSIFILWSQEHLVLMVLSPHSVSSECEEVLKMQLMPKSHIML